MLLIGYDEKALNLVAILGGQQSVDADYDALIALLARVAADTKARTMGVANIMMVVEVRGPPSAKHRRAMADTINRIPAFRFAFVSDSTVARGITMAIHWLAPTRAGWVRSTHSTIDEALAWFEQQTPGSAAALSQLNIQARAAG